MALEKTPNYRYVEEDNDDSGLASFITFCNGAIVWIAFVAIVSLIGFCWLFSQHPKSLLIGIVAILISRIFGTMLLQIVDLKSDVKEALTAIIAGILVIAIVITLLISGVITILNQSWAQVCFIGGMMFLTIFYERIKSPHS